MEQLLTARTQSERRRAARHATRRRSGLTPCEWGGRSKTDDGRTPARRGDVEGCALPLSGLRKGAARRQPLFGLTLRHSITMIQMRRISTMILITMSSQMATTTTTHSTISKTSTSRKIKIFTYISNIFFSFGGTVKVPVRHALGRAQFVLGQGSFDYKPE